MTFHCYLTTMSSETRLSNSDFVTLNNAISMRVFSCLTKEEDTMEVLFMKSFIIIRIAVRLGNQWFVSTILDFTALFVVIILSSYVLQHNYRADIMLNNLAVQWMHSIRF